jgi:hypothetical protein
MFLKNTTFQTSCDIISTDWNISSINDQGLTQCFHRDQSRELIGIRDWQQSLSFRGIKTIQLLALLVQYNRSSTGVEE